MGTWFFDGQRPRMAPNEASLPLRIDDQQYRSIREQTLFRCLPPGMVLPDFESTGSRRLEDHFLSRATPQPNWANFPS